MEDCIPKCIRKKEKRIYLDIYAKPGSKREGIVLIEDDQIEIAIRSPAVDGKANSALIEYLVEILGISKNVISIDKGGLNRNKVIVIDKDMVLSEVYKKLKEIINYKV